MSKSDCGWPAFSLPTYGWRNHSVATTPIRTRQRQSVSQHHYQVDQIYSILPSSRDFLMIKVAPSHVDQAADRDGILDPVMPAPRVSRSNLTQRMYAILHGYGLAYRSQRRQAPRYRSTQYFFEVDNGIGSAAATASTLGKHGAAQNRESENDTSERDQKRCVLYEMADILDKKLDVSSKNLDKEMNVLDKKMDIPSKILDTVSYRMMGISREVRRKPALPDHHS